MLTRSVEIRCTIFLVLAIGYPRATNSLQSKSSQRSAHKSLVVVIKDLAFNPDTLTVNVGDVVEWKNRDIVPYTATADDKSFDSKSINPGSSWRFVFKKPGQYSYSCVLHPNMKANLIVK